MTEEQLGTVLAQELMGEIRTTQKLLWQWVGSGKVQVMNGQYPHTNFKHWSWLLGYETVQDMIRHTKPEHAATIRSIRGPHGLTIYKMLLARHEEN